MQAKMNKLSEAIGDLAAHNYPGQERAAWAAFHELQEALDAE